MSVLETDLGFIRWTPESSNIISVKYSNEDKQFLVVFKGEFSYLYKDVPQDVAQGALNAKSIGSFVHKNIKGKFIEEKVS